jgi:ABC-2 type transport system ATP-binding protein
MRQRVKLAQALVHDPKLVLLDEPTNGLDPGGRDDMLALVRRIGRDFGIPVLVTSHLLGELERISDHVVIIDAGRLLRSSATAEFTRATGMLVIEVYEPPEGGARDRLGRALAAAGAQVRPSGRLLELQIAGEESFDLVRDLAADLGLGLVRMQQQRHHIDEVFRDDGSNRGSNHVAS